MSFIVTDTTKGTQVSVQAGQIANAYVNVGDSITFSGGNWDESSSVVVQQLVNGVWTNLEVVAVVMEYGQTYFVGIPHIIPSDFGTNQQFRVVGEVNYGYFVGGTINVVNQVEMVTVHFLSNNNLLGTTDPTGEHTYEVNTPVTITANPIFPSVFVRWEYSANGINYAPVPNMAQTDTILAFNGEYWKAVFGTPCTLEIYAIGSGTGSVMRVPYAEIYLSGDIVQLTANPISGSVFSGWSGNLTGSANPTTITMNGNKVVTATFNLGEAGVEWVGSIPSFKDGTYKWKLTFNITPIPFLDNYIVDWLSQRPEDEAVLNDSLHSQGISGTITITDKTISRHQNVFGNVDQFTITYTYTLVGTGLSLEGQQALVAWIPILLAAIPAIITLLTAVVYFLIINSIVAGITAIVGPDGKNVNILVIGGICIAGLLLLKD